MLVHEVIDVLGGQHSVLDCTAGGGGHTIVLLAHGAEVTGLDRDPEAVRTVRERGAKYVSSGQLRVLEGDFTRLDDVPGLHGRQFDGILADLGVSSHQIDADARGFSFRPGVPLDMRMAGTGETAADFLNHASLEELARVFREYADEPHARRLASEVVRRRANHPMSVSDDLVRAIRGALGAKTGPSDFARLFQAVRIAVNGELEGLARALPVLRDRLNPGGVLTLITYHSGEDRLVKRAMREWSKNCHCPPRQPVCTCRGHSLGGLLTRKAVTPTPEETARNPRARSAKLRAWRKTA